MGEVRHEATDASSNELFDRYTLPKIALTIILIASLAGTFLTVRLSGVESLIIVVAKWGYLVSLGVLVGGLCWKHLFVRPQDLNDGTDEYCSQMYNRFDTIALLATIVLAVTGGIVLPRYWRSALGTIVSVSVTLLFIGLLAVLVISQFRTQSVEQQFRGALGVSRFAFAVGLLAATSVAEVGLRHGTVGLAGIRTLHLLAFAIWLGGAVWNIFVAVPTGQQSPTIPVVRAAGQQLERFRWVVRFIFPTIFVTGLYQAYSSFGNSLTVYLGSSLGLIVVAKLGLIGALVVIFKLCPMWRACSPIEGVCDLEEMGQTDQINTTEGTTDD
ncbi:hypothetical protein [Halovenus halobia]|uniref:hypothetical protein n=1 Tax=Halovenus halobia TaxID=3396622 RepID=UPI003F55FACC